MANVSNPELSAAYQEVLKDAFDTNWCVFGYEGAQNIVLQGKGNGGLEELKAQLHDDQCQFAYLRVIAGDSESKRAKFVFISWCGDHVGALKRAKMSVHKASVKTVITNFAIEIHATKQEELVEEDIMTKVIKSGGANYSGNTSTN
ncbi:actin binding protein [Tieghemostelium lacteum]|uniref:Coactosin n=1 Tax=Tieghemostelium lacteum TaxID=361077 RepID=A0A152A8G1_TIELA|nr:actin binding protein [Tieghemostelium lacteum]|eukprot:KYR02504.1 actin binding protein [Tieghemostelium lacteum]